MAFIHGDPLGRPAGVEFMRDQVHRDVGVLYQAMIVPDNLGAAVPDGRDSVSVVQAEKNRALAAAFLGGSVAEGSTDPARGPR